MRVLAVTHGPTGEVGAGVFGQLAEERGHELEIWCPPQGVRRRPLEAYGAVMVFGGAMHPDQDEEHPWLPSEGRFLREALEARVPLLGVCLGAQLIARAAGAWVGPASESEIGWYEVELTSAGRSDPVFGALPPRFEALQWHHYTYGLPDDAVELARSRACTQAYRLGVEAWAIQFHAEVTLAMVESWLHLDGYEVPGGPEALAAATRERIAGWNELGRALCGRFLDEAERHSAT